MILIFIIISPLLGSLIAATLQQNARNAEAWLAGIVAFTSFVLTLSLYPQINAQEIVRYQLDWAPALGLEIHFRMDGFAWLMATIVSGIGVLVVIYARYYMSPSDPVPRFFAFLLAFMSAMLGLVLSGNLLQLVVFWEFTSILSFMLISYWYHRSDARNGAFMAFTVTAGGGLCLLAGVLILGQIVGSYDLDTVLQHKERIQHSSLYTPALILIGIGALTKSAQFPFQFWLPNAMAAPTPVSAFLHSATMVKAGVFLLARLWPVLAGTDEWFWLIGGSGLITLLLGAFLAMFQTDLKGVLAYSTISHLGLITFLLGMNSPLALVAALLHLISHATFKASLFMAAGIVDHEAGTRDIQKLSGLYKKMPLTTILATVSAAAMAGVPLLNGFISKEMFFAESTALFESGIGSTLIPVAAVIAGAFSVAYSLRFIGCVFFGKPATQLPSEPHDPPIWMLVPSVFLVSICFIVGILPHWALGNILHHASQSILQDAMPTVDLALWHGWNTALMMSICTLIIGIVLYIVIRKYFNNFFRWIPYLRVSSSDLFHRVMSGVQVGASTIRKYISSHKLQTQILVIIIATCVFVWQPLSHVPTKYVLDNADDQLFALVQWFYPAYHANAPFLWVFFILWLIGMVSSIAAAIYAKYHRLQALIALSMVGLVVCATFVLLSAPDLALTQLVVEAATIVLLLLGLRWLPQRRPDWSMVLGWKDFSRRSRDILIATGVGIAMSLLAFTMMTYNAKNTTLADYYLAQAIPAGKGTNVVNILLVDFRGFDTFGEIMVLVIVALSIYALLKRFRPVEESILPPFQQRIDDKQSNLISGKQKYYPSNPFLIQAILGRVWFRCAILISLYFLLRGHNLPGGGFIAGLVLALAIILQYMLSGATWILQRKPIHPLTYMSTGLLIAGVAGLSSWSVGQPFLSAFYWQIAFSEHWNLQIPSVLVFDVGVYLIVIGATVLILSTLAQQSLRSKQYHAQLKKKEL